MDRRDKERLEGKKEKLKEDFRNIKDNRKAYTKQLTLLKARRIEALGRGDKEEAKRLKEQIEALATGRREDQTGLWRDFRHEKEDLLNEKRHLEERERNRWPRRRH